VTRNESVRRSLSVCSTHTGLVAWRWLCNCDHYCWDLPRRYAKNYWTPASNWKSLRHQS